MEENKAKPKVVETFAEDMAEVIHDDKGGLVKKIIHEEEAREMEKRNLSPESKKNQLFLLLSSFLLLLSLGLLLFLFLSRGASTVDVKMSFTPMIFNDGTGFVEVADLTKDQIMQSILSEVDKAQVQNAGVEGIYLTLNKNIVGLRQFISLIKGNLILAGANLVDDNFLLGFYDGDTKDVFLLLKMRSLPDIFDNMHIWENKIFYDLHGLFGTELTPDTSYLLTKNFENGIVQNKNARILYDKNGGIVMMYVFVDNSHVVVTDSVSAVREIILRLSGSQIKQ